MNSERKQTKRERKKKSEKKQKKLVQGMVKSTWLEPVIISLGWQQKKWKDNCKLILRKCEEEYKKREETKV